jgi:hemerythrin superfamily protein
MNRLLISAAAVAALLGGATVTTAASTTGRDTIPPALSPFGSEHATLLGGFDAALARAMAPAATRAERQQFVGFLRTTLIPHAQVEERVLYPALESVLGTQGYATATMVLDHRAIARLTVELAALAPGDPAAFQRKALAVAALVENHFANEEGFVLPNLARKMSDRELRALLARMDAARIVQ